MKRFKQQIPFRVFEFKREEWDYPPHSHDHFEIILIKRGVGKHIINNISFRYESGDIFLIAPDDIHSFEIEQETSFCYIKFTELLFNKDANVQDKTKWMQQIETILLQPNLMPGDVKYDEQDKQQIIHLIDMIWEEHHQARNYSLEIIANAVSIILNIIARNICNLYCNNQVKKVSGQSKINEIITYIRHYIYVNSRVKIEHLAEHFNMSKNYISIFFKRHTGESLQQFILNYRMTLVENRIRLSNFTVSEIAFQLGYTDESHLTREFKKRYGMSPGEYRKTKRG